MVPSPCLSCVVLVPRRFPHHASPTALHVRRRRGCSLRAHYARQSVPSERDAAQILLSHPLLPPLTPSALARMFSPRPRGPLAAAAGLGDLPPDCLDRIVQLGFSPSPLYDRFDVLQAAASLAIVGRSAHSLSQKLFRVLSPRLGEKQPRTAGLPVCGALFRMVACPRGRWRRRRRPPPPRLNPLPPPPSPPPPRATGL